ncbi:MAG: hypothetical protein GX162_09370 [Firmicutes bacterium]|nr:hypothetical protein [Bacillota bacterium]
MSGAGFSFFPLLGKAGQEAGISSCGSLLAAFAGLWTVGLAIRLMDDYLDAPVDLLQGVQTSAHHLGNASLPYALVGLSVGSLLSPKLTAALFLSAYAIGMTSELTRALPSRLRGYQESLLAIVIGAIGAGPMVMAWALMTMFTIQALDDLIDLRVDSHIDGRNWCHLFGVGEVILSGSLSVAFSAFLSPLLTGLTLLTAASIGLIFHRQPGTVILK